MEITNPTRHGNIILSCTLRSLPPPDFVHGFYGEDQCGWLIIIHVHHRRSVSRTTLTAWAHAIRPRVILRRYRRDNQTAEIACDSNPTVDARREKTKHSRRRTRLQWTSKIFVEDQQRDSYKWRGRPAIETWRIAANPSSDWRSRNTFDETICNVRTSRNNNLTYSWLFVFNQSHALSRVRNSRGTTNVYEYFC